MTTQLNLVDDPLVNGHVIEASAGTGKTYSVAALVTRELALREDLRIGEVLITTFTRNAAAELRDRIRRRISDTAEALRRFRDLGASVSSMGDDEVAVALANDAMNVDDFIRRLERAVVEFDSATISTIHAVCNRIMMMAGLVGRSHEQQDLTEQHIAELVNDALVSRASRIGIFVYNEQKIRDLVATCLDSPTSQLWHSTINEDGTLRPQSELDVLSELQSIVTEVVDLMHERTANNPTFNDQVRQAESVLATPEFASVRERIAERYKLAFVDEAQDTDGLQWRLFHHIFPRESQESGRALVAVGDPKQAIYSFRGADVNSYLAARDTSNMSTLDTNYRSDQPLVTVLNDVFADASFGSDITYQPVVASPGHQHSAVVGVTPFEVLDIGEITNKNKVDEAVVRRILHLLNAVTIEDGDGSRPLEPRDICVLTGTNLASSYIQRGLARYRVPAVSSGAESVFDGELATEIKVLLHALTRIADVGRVRRVATSSFFGYSMTDPRLFPQSMVTYESDVEGGDLVVQLQTLLSDWNHALETFGVAGLQSAILSHAQVAQNLVAGTFGERNLTDFSHIFEILLGATSGKSVSATQLMAVFDSLSQLNKDAEIVRRRVESDAAAVQIMTSYGAKGLEFPVVIVAELWKERTFVAGRVPKYYRPLAEDSRTMQSVIDIGWAVGMTASDSPQFVVDAENEEQRRVLYVAMTRAKHHLTLCVPSGDSGAPIVKTTLNTGLFGTSTIPVVAVDALAPMKPYVAAKVDEDPELLLADAPAAIEQTFVRTSFTGLTDAYKREIHERQRGYGVVVGGIDEQGGSVFAHVSYAGDEVRLGVEQMPLARLRGGTYIGKVIHSIYERVDFSSENLEEEVRSVTTRAVFGSSLAQSSGLIADGLHRSLVTPLGPEFEKRTIADLRPSPQLQEIRFEMAAELLHAGIKVSDLGKVLDSFAIPGDALAEYWRTLAHDSFDIPIAGLINGSIDTVINAGSDSEPRLFITDWKSNRLDIESDVSLIDAYSPDRLVDAMTHHHYPLQALLYGIAMHRYLRWRAPGIDAESAIAGIAYFFIRGMVGPATPRDNHDRPYGVFTWTPPHGAWARLSDVLAGVRP